MSEFKRLTKKRLAFCYEYSKNGGNASEAYVVAFKKPETYSRVLASSRASEIMDDPLVIEMIDQLSEETRKRNEITVDKIIQNLAKTAFSDINDAIEVKDGQFRVKENANLDALESGGTSESSGDAGYSKSVAWKRADRLKAMEILAKILGFYERRTPAPDYGASSERILQSVRAICYERKLE